MSHWLTQQSRPQSYKTVGWENITNKDSNGGGESLRLCAEKGSLCGNFTN